MLCNPGHGLEAMKATATIYIGLQLILPGETAPNHRHTPSAIMSKRVWSLHPGRPLVHCRDETYKRGIRATGSSPCKVPSPSPMRRGSTKASTQ